mgnify:CR=1 FL=1
MRKRANLLKIKNKVVLQGTVNERSLSLRRPGDLKFTVKVRKQQKILKNSLDSKNRFGVGGMFMFDESLGGGLKSS